MSTSVTMVAESDLCSGCMFMWVWSSLSVSHARVEFPCGSAQQFGFLTIVVVLLAGSQSHVERSFRTVRSCSQGDVKNTRMPV